MISTAFDFIRQKKYKELTFFGITFIKYRYDNLKYFLINKINKDKYKIVTVNGYKMYIFLEDIGISKELYLYKIREKFATKYMESFLKEDDIIIEIGANIGYYVLLENKISKKGKIFACEPMTFNRKLLERNIALNNLKNVDTYSFAMGEKIQEQEFYIYDKINWSSFNKNVAGKIVSTEIVKTITIDHFVKEYLGDLAPTVLRMDVEGYEYEVIKGALKTIDKCDRLKIFLEIHPKLLSKKKLDELLKIFKDNNFKVKAIINECAAYLYPYLDSKILSLKQDIPYGYIGNDYENLEKFLQMKKGTEVFLEKEIN